MESIEQKIRNYIVENFLFGDETVLFNNDDSLSENGIIDSTGILGLVNFLENEYQISIKNEEIVPENLDSINKIVRFLKTKFESMTIAS
ncbi:MAG: acyl carrier protein [Caldisericaceae bacterium]|nr:acyl carrier protein [Caldisericaceae bacterium]